MRASLQASEHVYANCTWLGAALHFRSIFTFRIRRYRHRMNACMHTSAQAQKHTSTQHIYTCVLSCLRERKREDCRWYVCVGIDAPVHPRAATIEFFSMVRDIGLMHVCTRVYTHGMHNVELRRLTQR